MSCGSSEFSLEVNLDSHFQNSGTVYVASSGDNGTGVERPATASSVLAVGAIPLNCNSNLNGTRTTWSSSTSDISRYVYI